MKLDRMDLWTLDWIIERRGKTPTPIALKIAVIHQSIFGVGLELSRSMGNGVVNWLKLATAFALGLCLVGLWNMKRWPVILLAFLGVAAASSGLPDYFATTERGVVGATLFSGILIVWGNLPAIVGIAYWRRMTLY